jgi:hypothetical protein
VEAAVELGLGQSIILVVQVVTEVFQAQEVKAHRMRVLLLGTPPVRTAEVAVAWLL